MFRSLRILSWLSFCFVCATALGNAAANRPAPGKHGAQIELRLDQMRRELNLTPKQVEQIRPILIQFGRVAARITANKRLTDSQRDEEQVDL